MSLALKNVSEEKVLNVKKVHSIDHYGSSGEKGLTLVASAVTQARSPPEDT
jgi:hypothetical protein